MQLLGLSIAYAAWFPWAPAPAPDSNMRVDAKGALSLLQTTSTSQTESPDDDGVSAQYGQLASDITAADADDSTQNNKLKGVVSDAIADVELLKVDVQNAVNKTVAEAQTVGSAATAISTGLTKATQSVQAVVDLDKSSTKELKDSAGQLSEKAQNAVLSIKSKGQSYLSKLAGDFDVNYLTTEQKIGRDMQQIQSTTNKVETQSHAAQEKAEMLVSTVADKMDQMKDKLADNVDDLEPKIKDLAKLMKESSKSTSKQYEKSMKAIGKDVDDEEPVDVKDSMKMIKDAGEEVEDAAEDGADDTEDEVDDIVKEANKKLKDFQKETETTEKKMTKAAEKGASTREKDIKKALKMVDGGIDDTEKLSENIKSQIVDSVNDRTRKLEASLSEKTTEAAVEQSVMLKRTAENAEKAISGVQVSADAAAAAMNSDNGKDAADAAASAYKVVQGVDDEAQSVAMSINSQIGGVTSQVSTAKTSVAQASDTAADVTADIEAANLAAKSQQDKAQQEGARTLAAMGNEQSAMALDMKIKVGASETDMKNEKDSFAAKSSSVKQTLEMPITQQADALTRELETKISQATISNNEVMGGLQAQLKDVKGRMQAAGIDTSGAAVPENSVLNTVEKAMHDMQNLQRAKDTLSEDVDNTPLLIQQKTEMAVRNLQSYARQAQQDIVKAKLDDVRKTETGAFDQLGILARNLDQNEGKTVANEQRDKEQADYLEKRIAALVDDMGTFKKNHEEVADLQKSKMAQFQDELLPAYTQTASAAAASTQAVAESALSNGEQSLEAMLHELAGKMTQDASDKGANSQAEIQALQEKILKVFASSKASEDAELSALYTAAEGMTYDTKNATQMLEEEQEAARDKAVEADQAAQLDVARVNSQAAQSKQDEQSLDETVTKEADAAIAYAQRTASAEITSTGEQLQEKVGELSKQANAINNGAENTLQSTQNGYAMLDKEVQEVVKGTQTKQEYVKSDMEEFTNQMGEQAEEDHQQLGEDDASLQTGLKTEESKFSTTENRDKQLVGVMGEDASGVREEADAAFATMKAQADAKTKAMAGEIDASFETAQMTAGTAHQSLEASKLDLGAARSDLLGQMNNVQGELNRKANETGRAIKSFEGGIASEREMLEKNVAYLRAYDLTTQSQILALLQKVETTIGNAAETANGGFKEVEAKEKEIAASMGSLLEGQAFSTLQRIMEADNYVQKAAVENSELVNYMNEFKSDQERFMTALVQALYDGQYALILHENEVKAEQAAIDTDANGLTDNVISTLSSLIDGNATDGEAAELEGMTASTLQMLLSKASTGTAQDKAQIALLMAKIQKNGLGGLSHLKNAQELVDAINQAVSGNGNYEAMKTDLQRVVDFNQKLVDDERKRMEARGVALSDKLFFGGGMGIDRMRTPSGFEHVPEWQKNEYKNQAQTKVQAAYSKDAFLERQRQYIDESTEAVHKALLQSTPKTAEEKERFAEMSALLAKNKKLMEENKALNSQHKAIGATIQDVKQQLHSGKPSKKDTL